ncbi:hypothetical protein GQ43DRAFT_311707 [Delitschia confertaspora ATCC 74209]|uniref:Uncharacterized protein n=1 Tax=Delitschia confertaspora ATCC 74209 TaxID=1513339 RepID=A0A9P4MTD6_9PLEO|nr:hypothetical protein GQ43DRAFT_311707 [Delitschia confertaspora ATCC 74209]
MVQQDAAIVPKMAEEGRLQRSSWKAEAIRRGDLKISGPIPITDDTPLNDEEERAYSAKHDMETPVPRSGSPPQKLAPLQPSQAIANAGTLETSGRKETQLGKKVHRELRHKRSSTAIRETSEAQRQSDMRSTPSPLQSVQDSSPSPRPKKKRGSLKTVFKKMFGRKNKEVPHDTVHKHGYHQSDPGVLTQASEKSKEILIGTQRISDIPIREFHPINPLGQHLPFPMNVNAPQEASPSQQYLTFESRPTLHQRRATLPSIVLAQSEAQPLSASWGHAGEPDSIPSPEIGVALSSPTRPRRRSQSAGAIRDLAKEMEVLERRRSEEIKFWRNSSVYSTATSRPLTAATVEPTEAQDACTKVLVEEISGSRSTTPEPIAVSQEEEANHVSLPVEAFDFGSLKSVRSRDSVPGTQPSSPLGEPPSFEGRIQRLESITFDLESSVRRLSGCSNRHNVVLESASKTLRSRSSSASDSDFSVNDRVSQSSDGSGSSKTLSTKEDRSTGSDSPPMAVPLSDLSPSDPRPITPLKPSLMPRNPNPASPPVPPEERFAAVYTILKHERAARKALESQVLSLRQEVTNLHAVINRVLSGTGRERGLAYPTPSPDAIISSNITTEDKLSTPRPRKGLAERTALPFDDSEEENIPPRTNRYKNRAQPIGIEQFYKSDGECGNSVQTSTAASLEDGVMSPDVWATPTEGGESREFFR